MAETSICSRLMVVDVRRSSLLGMVFVDIIKMNHVFTCDLVKHEFYIPELSAHKISPVNTALLGPRPPEVQRCVQPCTKIFTVHETDLGNVTNENRLLLRLCMQLEKKQKSGNIKTFCTIIRAELK